MSARATDVVFFGQEGAGSFNESGLAGARAAQAKGHAVNIHWIADPQTRNDALAVSYTHLTLPTILLV